MFSKLSSYHNGCYSSSIPNASKQISRYTITVPPYPLVNQTLTQSALLAGHLDTAEATVPMEKISEDKPQIFEDKGTFLIDHFIFFFIIFFLSIWVFFHEHSRFTGQQGKGEAISLTLLYNPLYKH